jgi:hypothetical protein
VSDKAFYIADQTALPLWQAPNGVFAAGGPDPEKETLTIFAPSGFRVLAPGKRLKNVLAGNLIKHDFRIKPDEDFLPYVVAGNYQEQVIRAPQGEVSFWTFEPLDMQPARAAAIRLSSSMRALEDFFGPAARGDNSIHVVEAPIDLPGEFGSGSESAAGGVSIPYGALLDSQAFSRGIADEAVLELVEYELARTWFGWRVRPQLEARILMGSGVGLFGTIVVAEARGQDQRAIAVASLMDRYDRSRRIAADRPLLEPLAEYSPAERISTAYKAALFIAALEDECGHEKTSSAFREIVHARANDDVGYEELRAALEFASGRDLAEVFRVWMSRPGIPDEFRARYAKASNAQLLKSKN